MNNLTCPCGKRPILKRKPFGKDCAPELIYECACGERGINGKTKSNVVYGWVRRYQLKFAIAWIRIFHGYEQVEPNKDIELLVRTLLVPTAKTLSEEIDRKIMQHLSIGGCHGDKQDKNHLPGTAQ